MGLIAKLLYRANRLRWAILKPVSVGVRVLLFDAGGKVLLVRHTYQASWYLPGGGVSRDETLEEAIRREAREEAGAELGEIKLFGVYSNFFESKSDHVIVFKCYAATIEGATSQEIERFAFFPPDALPEGTSPGTRRRVAEYLSGKTGPHVGRW